jgi:hypothetical protein
MRLKKLIKKLEAISSTIENKILVDSDFTIRTKNGDFEQNPDFYEFEETLEIITDLIDVLSNKIRTPHEY